MAQRKAIILCVDDEENPLTLRTLVLQKAGYEVVTARSGKEALNVTGSRSVDLVLSDHLMPEMNGVELAKKVKARHPNLPVVLISGVNDIPAGASTADAFVSKVEGPDILCQCIAAILQGESGHRSTMAADV
jgi:DNA-binding NtrC family response regulator